MQISLVQGTPVNASCPYGNLDPLRVVVQALTRALHLIDDFRLKCAKDFTPPSCELRCPVQEAQLG